MNNQYRYLSIDMNNGIGFEHWGILLAHENL